jgi:TonB family protein
MAHVPMSRPDPFDPPRPSGAPVSLSENEGSELADGLSLSELATALSAHGGGALSADLALDLVLNEIVEHARLATGATAAAIALARGDEIVCRATTGDNAPDLGVQLDVDAGLSGACVQSKKWQRCDDTETDSRVNAEVCRSLGVRSILVFPVVRENKLLGVFEIFSPRPNAFSDREIQTLQALSRSIINNVDRAADVSAPSGPAFPSPSLDAATSAMTADLESVDRLQIDSVGLDSVGLDSVQLDPEQAGLTEVDHEPDIPVPAADSSPGVTTDSAVRPKDHWTTVLTLAVIAVALFLGWMMGYVRRPRGPMGPKSGASVNAAAQAAQVKSPEASSSGPSAVVAVPDQATPASTTTAPVPSQESGSQQNAPQQSGSKQGGSQQGETGVVPGGLVVYEGGKVIFRTSSQSPRNATDTTGQPINVPSKVADQYLTQRVEPEYPEPAREQHIQGPVVLEVLVGKDGAVEKLTTISGDPQLASAATDAVRQWRFKPFYRSGSPEEFQTQITVSFRLP